MDKIWYLYMIECGDGTYYTGITTDVPRRLEQHSKGTGAKYTRGRGPLKLVYQETCGTRSEASKREYEVHHMTREQKQTQLLGNLTKKLTLQFIDI